MPGTSGAWRIVRRLVGLVGFGLGCVGVVLLPMVVYIGAMWGAAGDHYQRSLILYCVGVVASFLIAIVGFADWSLRDMTRSRPAWFVGGALALAVAWAVFGIDSTRAIRSVPEAFLMPPGTEEVGRSAMPAAASGASPSRAVLSVRLRTTSTYDDVEAFYRDALARAGWTYSWTFVAGDRMLNWDRDGLTFQLALPDRVASGPGPFGFRIYGPEQ